MAECLHCLINDLVQERVDAGDTSFADLAAMMVESLAELILIAPPTEQATLMADVLANFGQVYLEKSGAAPGEGGSSATH